MALEKKNTWPNTTTANTPRHVPQRVKSLAYWLYRETVDPAAPDEDQRVAWNRAWTLAWSLYRMRETKEKAGGDAGPTD